MVNWTSAVVCGRCGAASWCIRAGVWTCTACGKPMFVNEVAESHRKAPG